jgi:hypothetical protein
MRTRFLIQLICLLLVVSCTAIALRHQRSLEQLQKYHGWDRALEIHEVTGRPAVRLGEPEAKEMIASLINPFTWGRLVSGPALGQIRALPEVESVHRVLSYPLVDQEGRALVLTVFDDGVIDAFKLGPRGLGANPAIAAFDASEAQRIAERYPGGEVNIASGWKPRARKDPREVPMFKIPPATQRLSKQVFSRRPLWYPDATHLYVSSRWLDDPAQRGNLPIPELSLN